MRLRILFLGLTTFSFSEAILSDCSAQVMTVAADTNPEIPRVGNHSQVSPAANTANGAERTGNSRTFYFNYAATVETLPKESRVRVWIPLPQPSVDQRVDIIDWELPAKSSVATEPKYGNKILYLESKGSSSETLPFSIAFLVRRYEMRRTVDAPAHRIIPGRQRKLFLSANRRVPLQGKQLDLLGDVSFSGDTIESARKLYNLVDDHVSYDKSKPGYGHGDVLWVCDSRYGNCTDFHSLFISWARSKQIPAKFEIGFPVPTKRGKGTIGGYHCWAMFHDQKEGWIPVDISEADKHPELKDYYFGNLSENRVALTTGRDILLVPRQDGAPLNYFVYPYVEVNGEPWPMDKIKLSFSYEDVANGNRPDDG